ncbi:MAG: hypothetical protein ABIP75_12570 [Pyrinomonadaceae bacterium]
MTACFVSFTDISGIRHTVEVDAADSLYEAAVFALRTFKQHDCAPGDTARLKVEVRSAVTHTVTVKKIHEWLNGTARTPKEQITKDRLRALVG